MKRGDEVVARARTLLGTRFRPQGRSKDGLDCIGLALLSYRIPADEVPSDYRLSGAHSDRLMRAIKRDFRKVKKAAAGDLMLFKPGANQLHLAIFTGSGLIHADAGLRRVVERPQEAPWPAVGIFRKRLKRKG